MNIAPGLNVLEMRDGTVRLRVAYWGGRRVAHLNRQQVAALLRFITDRIKTTPTQGCADAPRA